MCADAENDLLLQEGKKKIYEMVQWYHMTSE